MATNKNNTGGVSGYLSGQSPAEARQRAEAARLTRKTLKDMAPKGTKTKKLAAGAKEAKKIDRSAETLEVAKTGSMPDDLFGKMSSLANSIDNSAKDLHNDSATSDATRQLLDAHIHPLVANAFGHIADAENVARGGKGVNWSTGGGPKLGLYGALHLGDAEIPGQSLSKIDVAEIKNQRLRTPGDHLNMAAKAIGMAAHHLRLISGQSGGDFTNNYRFQGRTHGDEANLLVQQMRQKESSKAGIESTINETNRAPFGTGTLFPNGEDHASSARQRYERSLEAQTYAEAKTSPRVAGLTRDSAMLTAPRSTSLPAMALAHFDANNTAPVRPTPRDFGGSTKFGSLENAFPSADHQARYEEAVDKFDNAGNYTERSGLVKQSALAAHQKARLEAGNNPEKYLARNNVAVPGAVGAKPRSVTTPLMVPANYDKKNAAADLEALKTKNQEDAFATYAPNVRATQQREATERYPNVGEMVRVQKARNQQTANSAATSARVEKYSRGAQASIQNMYDHFTATKDAYRKLTSDGVEVNDKVVKHLNSALGAFQQHSRLVNDGNSADPSALAAAARSAMDRTTDAAKYLAKAGSESTHVLDLAHLGAGSDLVNKYRSTLDSMRGTGIPRVDTTNLR